MKIAYFDCFSGISGDMTLGALIAVGLKIEQLEAELAKLNLTGFKLEVKAAQRGGITATKLEVILDKASRPLNRLPQIIQIIEQSQLSPQIKSKAILIFNRLAQAESKVHGTDLSQVHFHELGALDAIVDIVGSVIGLELLEIGQVNASALNVGSGTVNTEHGQLPIPAPATLELLKNIPIYSNGTQFELVTPTGAAIISTLAKEFGHYPAMQIAQIGYGAGSQELGPRPNMLRLVLGESRDSINYDDEIAVLETDVDNMNPEFYGWVMERLFVLGALDVSFSPAYMKRCRPGTRITVLCEPALAEAAAQVLMEETTTLGVRYYQARRSKLERKLQQIQTPYGPVQVKLAYRQGQLINIAPEYEDCRRIAQLHNLPIKQIYNLTLTIAAKELDYGKANN